MKTKKKQNQDENIRAKIILKRQKEREKTHQPTRYNILLESSRVGAITARRVTVIVVGDSSYLAAGFRDSTRGDGRRPSLGGKESVERDLVMESVSLTGVGCVHGSGGRRVGRLMLGWLRRYPEGCEQRPGHCTGGGCRWRRALLADEQARGREPEELGSLEPRPIVACQVWSLRRDLDRHRDARRYHAWNGFKNKRVFLFLFKLLLDIVRFVSREKKFEK